MRKSISYDQRVAILKQQGYQCAHSTTCLMPNLEGRPFEIDHKVALCFGGPDERDNLQALCCECHALKTSEEQRLRVEIASLKRITFAAQQTMRMLEDVFKSETAEAALPTTAEAALLTTAEAALPTTAPTGRKRKRHHDHGEMPKLATPLVSHPDRKKLVQRIRRKGEFDRVCPDPEGLVERIVNNTTYYKHKTTDRCDHYFFVDGLKEDLRGVGKVARAFLRIEGLPFDHVKLKETHQRT